MRNESTCDFASRQPMLRARPIRNRAAGVEERADGSVRVTVRKHRPLFLTPPLSWIIRTRQVRRYDVDRIGARVWRLCDGNHTVEAIIDEFAAAYRLSFHEARVAVTSFIRNLVQRGAVVMLMEKEGGAADAEQASNTEH